jgi:hypothetical protein
MPALTNEADRTDVLNRLRRAEGQIRGVQRMIEEGESCLPIGHANGGRTQGPGQHLRAHDHVLHGAAVGQLSAC